MCLSSHLILSEETEIRDRLTCLRSLSGNGGLRICFITCAPLFLYLQQGGKMNIFRVWNSWILGSLEQASKPGLSIHSSLRALFLSLHSHCAAEALHGKRGSSSPVCILQHLGVSLPDSTCFETARIAFQCPVSSPEPCSLYYHNYTLGQEVSKDEAR